MFCICTIQKVSSSDLTFTNSQKILFSMTGKKKEKGRGGGGGVLLKLKSAIRAVTGILDKDIMDYLTFYNALSGETARRC